MTNKYKKHFLLDKNIHYLNHGSFGACPRPVFEVYQHWQRELESQPVKMLARRFVPLMRESREALAGHLNCSPQDVVYFPNPTTAINMVARSLALNPGDEILTTDHEYGAMDRTWQFLSQKTEAKYINHPVRLPVTSHEEFIESFWGQVTDRTRVIFLSHITSKTALIFPITEICSRAKQAGILTIIDGAHAVGQIPLDLAAIGADIYTGACHKWLCAPKGSAFLYASKSVQEWLDPLIVSWGYQAEVPGESQFIDYHEWQGTRDISAYLSVPEAIKYQKENHWDQVRNECRELLSAWRDSFIELIGTEEISPDSDAWWRQMASFQLPSIDPDALKTRLYDDYQVEVPIYKWNDKFLLRVSVQGYNDADDLKALYNALAKLLPKLKKE